MADPAPEAEGIPPQRHPQAVEVISDDGRSTHDDGTRAYQHDASQNAGGGWFPNGPHQPGYPTTAAPRHDMSLHHHYFGTGAAWYPSPHPTAQGQDPHHAFVMFYESQMRDHAAAYASAAAGAAWAAAQIATKSDAAPPPILPPPYMPMMHPGTMLMMMNNHGSHESCGTQQWGAVGPPQHVHSHEHQQALPQPSSLHGNHDRPDEHPRKRHQRGVTSSKPSETVHITAAAAFREHPSDGPNNRQSSSSKRGRRRLRSALGDSSDTSNSAARHNHKHMRHHSGSNNNSTSRYASKRDSMSSLLGKTGVSAVYEWCDKQRWQPPIFVQHTQTMKTPMEFEVSVEINGEEWGSGRGGSKASAKQDAAQNALVNLVPGAVFDDNGLLVKMPSDGVQDDLAPNLASRLAIDSSKKKKRHWNVYPGTSTTTSEDDNENSYYASRGASVCSALLHTMWQIDESLVEPPRYTYDMIPNPASTNAQLKRKGLSTGGSVAVHRSSFRCVARLVRRTVVPSDTKDEARVWCDGDDQVLRERVPDETEGSEQKDDSVSYDTRDKAKELAAAKPNDIGVDTLSALGTGATKREARHKASSKLLAMLFPECDGMVEVKAAAEAAREKYAAARALKHVARRTGPHKRQKQAHGERGAPIRKRSIDLFVPDPSEPPLPLYLQRELLRCTGRRTIDIDLDTVSVESLSLSDNVSSAERCAEVDSPLNDLVDSNRTESRSLERHRQLCHLVDNVLHEMNELDEDGRVLPEHINDSDVGRTVLRRTEHQDLVWIRELLCKNGLGVNEITKSRGPLCSLMMADQSVASTLWGPVTVTLLLCRAIAPFEDPPLGFATLVLGFSMEEGRTLRVASIVSEPHLPKERFVECLERFASHMKCDLRTAPEPSPVAHNIKEPLERHFEIDFLHSIVTAYASRSLGSHQLVESKPGDSSEILDMKAIGTSLQSVQEEETEAEEINAVKATASDKSNKRSRVA